MELDIKILKQANSTTNFLIEFTSIPKPIPRHDPRIRNISDASHKEESPTAYDSKFINL